MSTAQKKINASLLGEHGIVQQLRAYALVREERPIYLLKYIGVQTAKHPYCKLTCYNKVVTPTPKVI